MRSRALSLCLVAAVATVPLVVSCSGTPDDGTDDGVPGGTGSGGTSGASPTGGTATGGTATGGAPTGGSSGATTGGTAGVSGTAGSGAGETGGSATGGTAGSGMGGSGGSGVAGSFPTGGTGGMPPVPPLDCGGKGTAIENHGPPSNRVNYVIVGDGYSEAQLAQGGTLDMHLQTMTAKMFSDPIGQPYLRYRNFINICALRIPSTPICGSSTFGCCGNDSSRLANCNSQAVNSAISDNLPASFEVDWRAVVLNGSSWWNTGATLMLWSGGNRDAAGAALHEGGHGFHQLADEYGGCSGGRQVNVHTTNGMTDGKWDGWLGFMQTPGTGLQDFFQCDGNVYRPTQNSMMNSLFGNNPNTSFNAVSREKMIMDIWRIVTLPYDSVVPPAGAVTNPASLTVNVIDPAVISVDWSVDGNVVARNGGPTYAIAAAGLAPGSHMVTARAYDNAGMDLVKQVPGTTHNRQYWGSGAMGHSDKTVTWTVTIP